MEYLAEGGMGAIYLGKRIGVGGFEKQVVLKQLLPEFSSDPQITELFLQEARLSASLDHQSIVYTLDLVEVAGSYYIVMEYVRGGDLRALLRRARRRGVRFSPAAALLIGRDLLDALDYAHQRKRADGQPLALIHRDISPSNILLSASGEVKLTDFGIARASTHSTTAYKIRGKVGYMSPEQARGEELDARSDLFSLAVVLYEVVCGERLFVGNLAQSPALIYSVPVPPPSRHCAGLPADFDKVLLKALSLSRDERFQTAGEFQEALTDVARRNDLLLGHAKLAAHLREVCGPDPDLWLRDEDRTGTAMIAAADEDRASSDDDIAADDDHRAGPAAHTLHEDRSADTRDDIADYTASRPRPRRPSLLPAPAADEDGPTTRPGTKAALLGSARTASQAHQTIPLPGIGAALHDAQPVGEATEPTSLLVSPLVDVLEPSSPELFDTTQPMEKQPAPINIAALARKMLPGQRSPSSPPHIPPPAGSRPAIVPERRDDTAAMTAPRPATVRMQTQSEAEDPVLPSSPRAWQLTRRGILVLSLLILCLLGLGIAMGMLLSSPHVDGGEPRVPGPEAPSGR